MNTTTLDSQPNGQKESTDTLVLLAGLVFVGLGIAWLVVTQPWASDDGEPLPTLPAPTESAPADGIANDMAANEVSAEEADAPRTELESTLDDPLRMAGLALEAGMLIQPESLSAWSLYLKAMKADPQNPDAKLGLTEVADALMARAAVAMEQDRTSDAARLVNLVLIELPEHFDANEIARDLPAELLSNRSRDDAKQVKASISKPKPAPISTPKIANKPKLAKAAAKSPADIVKAAAAKFDSALAENRLLTPKDDSARFHFEGMLAADADDERVQAAQRALFDRLINRAAEATASADEQAAESWLAAAEGLQFDADAVASGRASLEQRMIQLATARPIPVSDLTLLDYTPPEYPSRALERNIEGWVDLEFTVTKDGTPADVAVINASHERYFSEEAVEAVNQWQFEPRLVRGQKVDQRTFTRLSFKLQ